MAGSRVTVVQFRDALPADCPMLGNLEHAKKRERNRAQSRVTAV
jgi:hypothetical protein